MIYINARFLTQKLTGVQRYAIELSKRLKEIFQDEVEFVCPHNIVNIAVAEELGVRIVGTHTGHLWEQYDLPVFLIKRGSPLLLNLSNTAPILYFNKVTSVHDITFVRYPRTFSRLFVILYRVIIPLVIKSSKHIFTVSEFSASEISNFYHVRKNKISVVYNAVSEEFKASENKARQNQKYFMAVSSIKENKNFIFILEAFKRFSSTNRDVDLYVIGDMKSKSFNTIDFSEYMENKQIKLLGRVSDEELIKYYNDAFAFIFPSLYEGFGIPPLEAQACGCPSICANSSCLPEVFRDSVLYCDPNDVSSLVKVMNEIVNDVSLRELLINKGYDNVKRYSWESSAAQMSEVLKKFI